MDTGKALTPLLNQMNANLLRMPRNLRILHPMVSMLTERSASTLNACEFGLGPFSLPQSTCTDGKFPQGGLMSQWVCRAWSKTLLISPTAPMMNILTSSHGKPATSTSVSEMCQHLRSDNCKVNLYCDSTEKVCIQRKDVGTQCSADKE